MKTAKIRLKHK